MVLVVTVAIQACLALAATQVTQAPVVTPAIVVILERVGLVVIVVTLESQAILDTQVFLVFLVTLVILGLAVFLVILAIQD